MESLVAHGMGMSTDATADNHFAADRKSMHPLSSHPLAFSTHTHVDDQFMISKFISDRAGMFVSIID